MVLMWCETRKQQVTPKAWRCAPYELRVSPLSAYDWTGMYPVLVRGEAYLAAHQSSEAAAEFQKILDHCGVVSNEPIGALAHRGLARA